MSAHLHSFGCHVSSIALASTGDAAYALAHVFGNEWSGQIAVTRAGGEALTLQQQHGVTCAAWLAGDQAAVFGNEEGDLVCVRPAESGGKEALEEMAAAHDFDAPVAMLRTDRDGGGDGKSVVACSWDGMCRIYDVSSDFREVARSDARVDVRLLDCASIAPDQFAVLGEQGWLAVYDFRSPNVGVASCHVTAVEPFSSGRLAVQAGASALLHVGGVDGHVHTWDTRKLSTRLQSFPIWLPQPSSLPLPSTPPLVTCLLWHEHSGCVVAGRSDGGLWIGDASGGKTLAGRAPGGAVTAMASSADGSEGFGLKHILSGGADGHVTIHSIA